MRRTVHPIDGSKVRSLRDEKGLSARQFAALLGASESHIGRIENCERQPSPKLRKAITDALGVDLDAIARAA